MKNQQHGLKVVVVDDQPLALEVLEGYLEQLDNISTVSLFGKAVDALEYFKQEEADVLFLDIEMPGMTGIEFLRSLSRHPLTVFTTAYRNYAFEGYELGVIDFLLKPISFQRFKQAMEKVTEFLMMKEELSNIEQMPVHGAMGSIFVKSGVQRIRLDFDEVSHIQGLKDYAIIYTLSGKILLKGSVKAMLDIFPREGFIRVHKSFIVSLSKINRIERNQIILKGFQVPIGRSYREELLNRVNRY